MGKVIKTFEGKYKKGNFLSDAKMWLDKTFIKHENNVKVDCKASGLCDIDGEAYEFVTVEIYRKVD